MKCDKRNFWTAPIQYLAFLLLSIPCLLMLAMTIMYTIPLHNFSRATDLEQFPPVLDFFVTILDFINSNFNILLLILIVSFICYEILYKKPNKNKIRLGLLSAGIILIATYTILFQFQIVCFVRRALMHPKMKSTIQQIIDEKDKKAPNEEAAGDSALPRNQS
jgi:type II secretory pathway component PulF